MLAVSDFIFAFFSGRRTFGWVESRLVLWRSFFAAYDETLLWFKFNNTLFALILSRYR